jgi:hypothetical protein
MLTNVLLIGNAILPRMAKKSLEQKIDVHTGMIEEMDTRMEKGFSAVAEDIADSREKMGTKEQLSGLQTQVNFIEQQLRETKTEVRRRTGRKVFGAAVVNSRH